MIYILGYIWYSVVIVCVLFMSSLIGSHILRKVEISSPEFKKSLAIGTGLTILAFSSLILLLVHIFYWYVLLILSAIVIYLLFKSGFFRLWLQSVMKWRIRDLVVLLALIGVSLPSTLHPPTYWDSIEYHLPIVRMFTDSHHLAYNPFLREDFLPESAETLYSIVYAFTHSGISIQMFVSSILVLLSWSVGSLVLWVTGSWAAGRSSGFLVVGVPIILQLGVVAYTDIALCFMVFLGTTSLLTDIIKNPKDRMFVSAIVFGFAIAIKDTGGLFWAISFLVFAFYEYRKRAVGWTNYAKHALVIGIIAVPWYIRNFIYTGNPFYPLFTSIIPNRGPWTTMEARSQVTDYNMGNIGGFLLHPMLALSSYLESGHLSIPILVGLVLYIVWTSSIKLKLNKSLISAIIAMLIISYTTVFVRYLIPGIVVIIACSGTGFYFLASYFHRKFIPGTGRRRIISYGANGVILTAVLAQTWYSSAWVENINAIDTNPASRDTYLSLRLPSYPAFEYLNTKYHSNYTVYDDNLENMRYYCQGKMIGDWFGPDSYFRVFGNVTPTTLTQENIKTVYRTLNKQNIGFLLVSGSNINATTNEVRRYFKLVFADNGYDVFKVIGVVQRT